MDEEKMQKTRERAGKKRKVRPKGRSRMTNGRAKSDFSCVETGKIGCVWRTNAR